MWVWMVTVETEVTVTHTTLSSNCRFSFDIRPRGDAATRDERSEVTSKASKELKSFIATGSRHEPAAGICEVALGVELEKDSVEKGQEISE